MPGCLVSYLTCLLQVDALKHADNYGLATCSRVTFGRYALVKDTHTAISRGS